MRFSLGSLLIVSVAVAAAIGYGSRAAGYIHSLILERDAARAAIIVFAAILALVPLAFVLAVRLAQLAIWGPRRHARQSQPTGDEPLAESGVSQGGVRDGDHC